MGDRRCGYKYQNLRPEFCKKCQRHFMALRADNKFCSDVCRKAYNGAIAYRRKVDAQKAADRSASLQRQDPGADRRDRGVGPEVQAGQCGEVHRQVRGHGDEAG